MAWCVAFDEKYAIYCKVSVPAGRQTPESRHRDLVVFQGTIDLERSPVHSAQALTFHAPPDWARSDFTFSQPMPACIAVPNSIRAIFQTHHLVVLSA